MSLNSGQICIGFVADKLEKTETCLLSMIFGQRTGLKLIDEQIVM